MSDETRPAEPTLGPYTLIRKLGAGGMGEVHLARDPRLDRQVAIKVLPVELRADPERRTRFLREARAVAKLSHPNITTIHEVGEDGGRDYLAFEYVDGSTLRDIVARRQLAVTELLDLAVSLADAIAHAHDQGILHRDLKPANVMVTAQGHAKLLDFGLAKVMDREDHLLDQATVLTVAGGVCGTPSAMSPEQALGRQVDERSDIFSFGSLLYEMAAREPAFGGRTMGAVTDAVINREPAPLETLRDDLPPGFTAVVATAMRKTPGERYQRMSELAGDLREIVRPTGAGLSVAAETRMTRPRSGSSARRHVTGAIAIAAVATVLAATLLLRQWWPGPAATVARIESVVALPSQVFGPDEDGFLADAIPSTLSTRLSGIEGLETKAPPSSLELDRLGGDRDAIARAYDISALVLTSVATQGDELVLNVQLVDARERTVHWSREFTGRRTAYLDLVHQAADGLLEAVRPSAPGMPARGTTSISEAELAYQRGAHFASRYVHQVRQEDFDLALSSLERALELDEGLALAPAQIALLYDVRYEFVEPTPEIIAEIESWARRSLDIDPRTGLAWAALSEAEQKKPDVGFAMALEHGVKAAAFAPRDANALNVCASALFSDALTRESCRRAYQQDPLYLYPPINIALIEYLWGRSTEGLDMIDEALEVDPDFAVGILVKALLEVDAGSTHAEVAVERVEQLAREKRLPETFALVARHALLLARGEVGEPDPTLDRLLEIAAHPEESATLRGIMGEVMVHALARHGRHEPFLVALERLHENGNIFSYDWLRLNGQFDPVREDPRFSRVVARARSRYDQERAVLDAARVRGELPGWLDRASTRLADRLRRE